MADFNQPAGLNEKKRKRPRAARACELCRAKKYRCDELFPCSNCKRQKVECIYDVADHVRQRMLQCSNGVHTEELWKSQQGSSAAITAATTMEAGPRPQTERWSMTPSSASAATRSRSTGPSQWTQINVHSTAQALDVADERANVSEIQVDNEHDVEVSDVNLHTQNVEFHGKTSSLAFLAALQPQSPQANRQMRSGSHITRVPQQSLVSMLHNEEFSPEALANTQHESALLESERYYFRQAQIFLDGYFSNLHFIHPILDRQAFMARCEDLWFGNANRQPKSFIALYYSIMSLGALIKTWDEDKIDGLSRLEWSRQFFNLTRTAIGNLASMTAVESVQCLFFMAKISQNELNPSLAYLYLGWATRATFSAGFNRRQPISEKHSAYDQDIISRLWWGLYSLEIEVSFALGRPDSLGEDAFHNQIMPAQDETETAIIPVMVHFARIVKEVSVSIYLSEGSILEKTSAASRIEQKMNDWLEGIPSIIKPAILTTPKALKITKAPTWAKRQRLVLELRFFNVKMVLFRPFLTVATRVKHDITPEIEEATEKCVDAAKCTIELMHDMYCHHAFFRTWWYNATYILYAASIILCYAIQVAPKARRLENLQLGNKAVEILDAMEESTVSKNASHTIKQIIASAHEMTDSQPDGLADEKSAQNDGRANDNDVPPFAQFADESLLSFLNLDENFDFLGMTFPLNSSHFPFWTDQGEQS